MTMILLFAACTFINVITGTIKSVATIKGSNISAAVWSAINAGLYSFIVILTATADLPIIGKIVITVIANLIGVYSVKLIEEKLRKDKMWKIEMSIHTADLETLDDALKGLGIPHNYMVVGKHTVFNCYCETKQQTADALEVGKLVGAKCFANETTLAP